MSRSEREGGNCGRAPFTPSAANIATRRNSSVSFCCVSSCSSPSAAPKTTQLSRWENTSAIAERLFAEKRRRPDSRSDALTILRCCCSADRVFLLPSSVASSSSSPAARTAGSTPAGGVLSAPAGGTQPALASSMVGVGVSSLDTFRENRSTKCSPVAIVSLIAVITAFLSSCLTSRSFTHTNQSSIKIFPLCSPAPPSTSLDTFTPIWPFTSQLTFVTSPSPSLTPASNSTSNSMASVAETPNDSSTAIASAASSAASSAAASAASSTTSLVASLSTVSTATTFTTSREKRSTKCSPVAIASLIAVIAIFLSSCLTSRPFTHTSQSPIRIFPLCSPAPPGTSLDTFTPIRPFTLQLTFAVSPSPSLALALNSTSNSKTSLDFGTVVAAVACSRCLARTARASLPR